MRRLLQPLMTRIQRRKKNAQATSHDITNRQTAKKTGDYFATAQSWADDAFAAVLVSRNRYQVAFIITAVLTGLLALSTAVLAPLQRTQLVVVHEGESGEVWLSAPTTRTLPPMNWVRTQSEIAHYVETRESYDPLIYADLAAEVSGMSSDTVEAEYEDEQASSNPASPINQLGDKGYRRVIVHSVLSLDSSDTVGGNTPHINLAQVDFDVVTHTLDDGQSKRVPYTALISWEYHGVPSIPSAMLQNWDGFTVTHFAVQPVNVGH